MPPRIAKYVEYWIGSMDTFLEHGVCQLDFIPTLVRDDYNFIANLITEAQYQTFIDANNGYTTTAQNGNEHPGE